jgi:hypothetical protein
VAQYEGSEMPPAKGSRKKVDTNNETTVVEAPKRKNKKAVNVVAIVTPQGIEGSFQPEPRRPLIVHLGIRTSDVVFPGQPVAAADTGDVEPEPYDALTTNVFAGGQEFLEEKKVVETTSEIVLPVVQHVAPMPCFKKISLMVQFKETIEAKKLPDCTNIACFWCAHSFDYQPCIIPEREVNAVYNVYGNFCSPECGVAYLLKEGIDPHVRWERMALLHRIYDSEGKGQIFPAPARECLSLFGGPMSIDVFRATMRAKKVRVDLHMPPMVSILGSIDTKPIDFFDTNTKNTGGPTVMPQRSVEEGLRLKRSKPLKDKESTLDTVMNIRINSTGGRGLGLGP